MVAELRALGKTHVREAVEVWGSNDDAPGNVFYARGALCADRLGACAGEGLERVGTPAGARPPDATRCGACEAIVTDVHDALARAPATRRAAWNAADTIDTVCADAEMRHEPSRELRPMCDAVVADHADAIAEAVAAHFADASGSRSNAGVDPSAVCAAIGECDDGGGGQPRRRRRRPKGSEAPHRGEL